MKTAFFPLVIASEDIEMAIIFKQYVLILTSILIHFYFQCPKAS